MGATRRAESAAGRVVARWIAVVALLGMAALGWRGFSRIPVRSIVVHGAHGALQEDVVRLSGVHLDSTLKSVSSTLVEDRVRRHPWVADARVNRLPTGTVSIRITERRPVLLALSPSGEPAYYLDAEGFRCPYRPGADWRVPVLTGLAERYHPVVPVRNDAVRRLAAALGETEEEVDVLLSEIHVDADGGLTLHTTVAPNGRTLKVRLGRTPSAERLARLRPFWDQVVLARPDVGYAWVDLRFDSQIVTSESS